MKQIFSGEVFEVMPLSNGIIFSYCKEIVEGEGVMVAYKMISFDNGKITDVAKNIYLITKFGSNYKSVSAVCENYIEVKSLLLPGGKILLLGTDGQASLLDGDATPIWSGELKYRGNPVTDIVMCKNSLWASCAESNVLLRYNIATMREELRIGGNKSPFNKPSSLFAEEETLIVTNGASSKLTEVNVNTYGVSELETFEEPVKQYIRVGEFRFVVLNSGLYVI
jgi:hypothetical protein